MGRWSDSVLLTKTAFRMIGEDKSFLLVPLLSGLVLVAMLLLFSAPWIALLIFSPGTLLNGGNGVTIGLIVTYLALYFTLAFTGTFFTAALVGMAMMKFDGKRPTVSDGIAFARGHIKKILIWSLFYATVGLIIRAISQKVGGLAGAIIGFAGGATWAIATYFVIPVIVFEPLGTLASVRRSASLFVNTLGRTLITNILVGLIVGLIFFGGFVLLVLAIWAAFTSGLGLALVLLVCAIAVMIFAVVLGSALEGIVRTALYRYATTGQVVPGLVPQAYQVRPPGVPPPGPLPPGTPYSPPLP